MRTCFVILHYLAEDVSCKCLDSILSLAGGKDVSIVVVDNCSPDGSGERLKKKYAGESCVNFVSLDSNQGFARGNNAGYRYAVDRFSPDFVVVMNNDVIISDSDFISKMEAVYSSTPFAVLGPDIMLPSTFRHQNPLRAGIMSLEEARLLRLKMALKLVLLPLFYAVGRYGSPNYSDKDWESAAQGCVLHGACLIFSRDFIRARREAFNPGTFLYCEEDILAVECRSAGLVVRYSPDLAVEHLEDKATAMAHKSGYGRARRKYLNLVRSLDVLVEILKKTGE